ncbi:MAG: hypothetical protein IM613_12370 [Cytophagales bacterium]|jgi:hypothetical protein|nr:hypothetical protein [Cytophagales bacterium]
MQIEIVKPCIDENGIEFYVSRDGTQTGVSISGLARLCGVDESSIRNIIKSVREEKNTRALKNYTGQLFHLQMTSEQQAKIVTTEAASYIIFYYAFESSVANDTAKFTAKQFATMGMHNWVKQVTGFAEENDIRSLTATVNSLVTSVDSLTQEVKSWRTVKRVADESMNGVRLLIKEIEKSEADRLEEEYVLAPVDIKTWSLTEWLAEFKGVTLDSNRMKGLGRSVAETYKSMTQEPIMKDYRIVNGNQAKVAVYSKKDFPILSVAFTKFMAG